MKSNQIPPGSFGIPILGETLFFIFDRDFGKKHPLSTQLSLGDITQSKFRNSVLSH